MWTPNQKGDRVNLIDLMDVSVPIAFGAGFISFFTMHFTDDTSLYNVYHWC